MSKKFQTIGIVGRPRNQSGLQVHYNLYNWLVAQDYKVYVDLSLEEMLDLPQQAFLSIHEIGAQVDLVVVVGGDGNLLSAGRFFSNYGVKLIGINRGNLGFLTDIDPHMIYYTLDIVLNKEQYIVDSRFLVEAKLYDGFGNVRIRSHAINEFLIHGNQASHIIDFDVRINNLSAFPLHGDGLIITTPTGSTAYNLSAGGPILDTNLDIVCLTPICPHTLSSRPLVVDAKSQIEIRFNTDWSSNIEVAADGAVIAPIQAEDRLVINRSEMQMHLVHVHDYNYYNVLSRKLGWLHKLF